MTGRRWWARSQDYACAAAEQQKRETGQEMRLTAWGQEARTRFRVALMASRNSAPVAQLDRASDFESAGRPFESGRARFETDGHL